MWYPETITVQAASEPVSLAQAKRHVRADFDDDNDYLEELIAAGRAHIEKYCGIHVPLKTVTVACDDFTDFAALSVAPLSSVTSITYTDTTGASATLPTSVYEDRKDGLSPTICLKYGQSWPSKQNGSRIVMTAVVGYGTVPPDVRHALLVWLASAYENRENAASTNWSTMDALLCNYRRGY